jgi:hypothetical protein
MAGLVPAIHVLPFARRKTWMPGTRPGMTERMSHAEGAVPCKSPVFRLFYQEKSSANACRFAAAALFFVPAIS